jgi:processive 1,2-diacylglycerol beta-glucosyltransferase
MNIIIMTASTGGGHNRASNALKDYILTHDPAAQVDVLDALEECSALLNSIVVKGHKAMVTFTPGLFGALYHGSDKPSALLDFINSVYSVCGKRLLPIIEEKHPDVVISCHPFTAGILGYIKTTMGYDVPLISIATDFIPHRSYVTEGVDAYVAAFDTSKYILTRNHSVPQEKVYVYGLPVYERFYEGKGRQRAEVLRELDFDPDKPTVLIMAGSFGFSDMLKIYESLVNIDVDYQIIVVTGRNKRLYDAFEKLLGSEDEFEAYDDPELLHGFGEDSVLRFLYNQGEIAKERITATFRRSTDKKKPTKLFYYIDNVDDYMHASDLIITKPGGLTASESIACALPMAIFMAFPGQEEHNASLLAENGTAVILEKGEAVTEQIGDLLKHPEKLAAMRESCRRYGVKNSCENIYRLAKRLSKQSDAE